MEHRVKPRCYLLSSTVDFLNEALSYKIGHLHVGTDAKWFFNINTTPSCAKTNQLFYVKANMQKRPSGVSRKLSYPINNTN